MAKSKTLIWVGVASALLIGGGIFWWWKTNKSNQDENTGEKEYDKEKEATKPDTGGVKQKLSPSFPPTPFKNIAEGNAFRGWMAKAHNDFRFKGQILDTSGGFDNDFIRKAYQTYGSEYAKTGTSSSVATYDLLYAKRDGDSVWSATTKDGQVALGDIDYKTKAGDYLGDFKGQFNIGGEIYFAFDKPKTGERRIISTRSATIKKVPKK